MKVHEIIQNYPWSKVSPSFQKLYPDQIKSLKAYELVYQKLKGTKPTSSDLKLIIKIGPEEDNGTDLVEVVGYKETQSSSPETEKSYSLEFLPWKEWLAMEIHPFTILDFTELEIISHAIYEMTFAGFDEHTIQQKFSQMEETVKKIKQGDIKGTSLSLKDLLDGLD
ncbi:hypothetical protein KIH41_17200 [Litoribacter ruber]|uniref:DUF6557 family protein n=1 Tax=Litoribacter ruber TaxID=702568 RepID=UPI001BDA56E9|nr:DUF6557 family protein [Litoribacter ruber]MBT0813028.1 hypothetical protein [Litoribacter ruber]